ncbi:hypothetical protein ACROYT_G032199 [Oculina patagonica]
MILYTSIVFLLLAGLTTAQNATEAAAANATRGPPTPTPPQTLSVECTHEHMMVYLQHLPHHTNLDMDRVNLKDANCKLSDLGNFNRTHLWMTVPFDSCMTNHTTSDETITYANSIIAETRASQGSFLISREFQAEFPFKCTYPRSAILSVASFSPREKVIYTRTAEFGNFTFTMDMYPTDQYEAPYDSYPVNKDLNDKMYLEVKVMSNDSQLVLIPEKCWATPSQDQDDDKSFAFIEDGCGKDATLVFDYEENAAQQFYLDAFRFLGVSADTVVYLHCAVEACRKGDSDSRCAEGCKADNSTRRRRSLTLDAVAQQTVTIGPVSRKITAAPVEKERKSVSSMTVIAAVAGVLGVVVLALIVALVVLYKRFHGPQNAASVVYSRTSSEDNKQLV